MPTPPLPAKSPMIQCQPVASTGCCDWYPLAKIKLMIPLAVSTLQNCHNIFRRGMEIMLLSITTWSEWEWLCFFDDHVSLDAVVPFLEGLYCQVLAFQPPDVAIWW